MQDALAKGYRLGFIGGTDNHYGQPGSCRCPMGGIDYRGRRLTGIAAVYAKELTRESLWDALWNRRTYAMTGARILLDFRIDGHRMGEEFSTNADEVTITGKVIGTKPIKKIEVVKNNAVIFSDDVDDLRAEFHFTDKREKDTDYYYLRVTQADKQMAWSSPVWVSLRMV